MKSGKARHCFNENPLVFEAVGQTNTEALIALAQILDSHMAGYIGALTVRYDDRDVVITAYC